MSDHQKTTQAEVSDLPSTAPNQKIEKFALFLKDGRNLSDVFDSIEDRLDEIEGSLDG